ncbi:WASH complex subunit 3 [Diabrotica virgifera virgifera]|uniref:WASH complex subunit 3 n=1 Tax=Diabrotica virgifera virgifera TaxID=50390 RepID=A0A6P7FEL6_DIAVI|nr:WASH complex subunit 3 [Diabrotica virgifera virgifera]
MEVEFPSIDPNEDLTQILPIQQKRTIAFVNHFIMNTVSHLNNFAQSCESRFMEFDYKIQKIEASLSILESQLSSISGLDNVESKKDNLDHVDNSSQNVVEVELPEIKQQKEEEPTIVVEPDPPQKTQGIAAKDDPRFKKFFKMLQFGVPEPAVKLKMKNEGIDPSILEKPHDVVPGLTEDLIQNESEEKSD